MVVQMDMPSDSQSLKKLLHDKIDEMSADTLSLVNRIVMQLELEELVQRLDQDFDADRTAGKLAAR